MSKDVRTRDDHYKEMASLIAAVIVIGGLLVSFFASYWHIIVPVVLVIGGMTAAGMWMNKRDEQQRDSEA